MKQLFTILFFLLCLTGECFAQKDSKSWNIVSRIAEGEGYNVAYIEGLGLECVADDGSNRTIKFNFKLNYAKDSAEGKYKWHITLFSISGIGAFCDDLNIEDTEGDIVDYITLRLSNGERLSLMLTDGCLVGSSALDDLHFALWDYSGGYKESSEDDIANSRYVLNQLMLYDIVTLELCNRSIGYLYFGFEYEIETKSKISFKTKFRSSAIIRNLVDALRDKVSDKTALPDVNNLDRSWSKSSLIRIVAGVARYENDIIANVAPGKKMSFNFELGYYSDTKIPYFVFYSKDYTPINLKAYWSEKISVWFKLSNGVKYTTQQALCDATITSNRMKFRASMNTFCDSRTPNKAVQPKALLQQLSTYDIVEMGVLGEPIDLSQCDGSTAEHFAEMCEKMLKHTGDANCFPTITKQPNTSRTSAKSSATPAKSKSNDVAIARADKRAVYLMEYANQINRKDYISPREAIYTPMAMFVTRDIPMDAVQLIMESAKGVKKSEIANDKFDSKVSVTPEGFYLRVRGYEAMSCRYMRVSYDNDNLSKITSLYFSYAMPKGWGKGDIAKYATAISEDINRLGVQMKKRSWSGGSTGYQGYHQGHTISIMYDTKYIKYSEPTISILITYDEELK